MNFRNYNSPLSVFRLYLRSSRRCKIHVRRLFLAVYPNNCPFMELSIRWIPRQILHGKTLAVAYIILGFSKPAPFLHICQCPCPATAAVSSARCRPLRPMGPRRRCPPRLVLQNTASLFHFRELFAVCCALISAAYSRHKRWHSKPQETANNSFALRFH